MFSSCTSTGWFQLITSLTGFVFLRSVVLPLLLSKTWSGWINKRRDLFANHTVSFVHAVTSTILVLSTFSRYPGLLSDMQGLNAAPEAIERAKSVLAFSTGYFIADCVDMAVSGAYGKNLGIWAHHVVTIFCYTAALHTCLLYPYLIFTLLVEVNSIFIHLRKLLVLYFSSVPQMPSVCRAIYDQCTTLMVFSFVPTRIIANWYLTYRLFMDWTTWAAPSWTWWVATLGMVSVNYYNLVLWGQVRRSVARERSGLEKKTEGKAEGKGKGDWKGQASSDFLE